MAFAIRVSKMQVYQEDVQFNEAQSRYKALALAVLVRAVRDYAQRHQSEDTEFLGADAYRWIRGRKAAITFGMCAALLGYDETTLRAICLSPRAQELAKHARNLE